MSSLVLLLLSITPAADPAAERIAAEIASANIAARIQNNLAPSTPTPKPPARDYAACVAAVDEGKTVVLCVGVSAPDATDFYAAELRDDKGTPFTPGRYLCWLENGVRRMQLKDPPASRPAPPAR